MNHGIYRLVFDNEHNNWVAVAEFVRGHGKAKGAARVGRTRRHTLAVSMGAAMMVAGMASALAAPAVRQLPVHSTSAAHPFVYRGSVAGGQPVTSGNTMTINQQTRTLGLNWESFNIGRDATVRFNQPDANSRVLNRIWDSNPSEIYGKLEANGQVYLINQNGILFGKDSQVNVGGLVASALNMSETMRDKLLDNGLPTTKGDSLEFAYDGTVGDFAKGTIVIEAGSEIKTPSGGRVVLIAPKTVENEGIIRSGGGAEAILAAGGKVILTAPEDPNLRGLLVETKSFSGKDSLGNTVTLDGTATNSGTINTGSGGVATLAALAVNQKGIVNASKAVNINGTTMLVSGETNTDRITINQRGSVAEVDWKSGFNVATGKTVEVVQSSKGDVLYNYVNDADRTAADGTKLDQAGRSTIDGTLKANGQVVLINEKGIDFGSNARVSASNFVASGLGMNPDIVDTGLLGQTEVTERAFYLKKAALMYDENDANKQQKYNALLADFRQATVNVANGAEIRSGDNGYVILAGSKVNQGGYISSKGGQVLLAAGADLYLKPGYSSTARGFTPEVNPLLAISSGQGNPWLALSRGADANSVFNSGFVYTPLGDITLVGHKITQAGTLLATTSVTTNGSIHLIARDQVATGGKAGSGTADDPFTVSAPNTFLRRSGETGIVASTGTSITNANANGVSKFITGTVGGTLAFVDGSRTVVAIDGSDSKTLTAKQTYVPSSIDAVARSITVGDAEVIAKGGNIRFSAQETFGEHTAFAVDPINIQGPTSAPPTGVGVFLSNGAHLDVSGTNATKSVADLIVEVELRGDEFADNPVQRNSVLRGQTAYVDIRDAVEIANLDSWFDNVAQSVYEKAAAGGKISIATSGSAIIQSGAELDVSGGAITYEAGKVRESYAITAGGRRYRLNDAPTNLRYGRLVTRWRKEAEYVEGKSAGTVSITGHSLAVDGTLKANTTVGTRQREISNPSTNRYAIPYGGQLIIKDAGQHFAVSDRDTAAEEEKQEQYTKAQIVFVRGAANAAEGISAGDSARETLELSQSLVDNGFSRFDITSDGRIEIPADVNLSLAAGGSFKASGRQIVVAGDISTASGEIELSTRDTGLLNLNDSKYSTLTLAATASLSTAGRWVNDYLDGKMSRTAKAIDGGDITLESAYDLDLQAGSVVDVSGGGYVSNKRKLTGGDAGSITLATGGVEDGGYDFTQDADLRDATLFLDGTLSGYALGEGGTLSIKTSQITIDQDFDEDSRDWTRADRLAAGQVGAAFDASLIDRGGFFSFSFVGRDGLTVADGVRLSPDPISWSLDRNHTWFRQASDTRIASFATSSVLHPELRSAPTNISLATRSWVNGDLLIGENAYVGVSAEGSIDLMSMAQLTVLGTLAAPAGRISLRRPATKDYDDVVDGKTVKYNTTRPGEYYSVEKQSESIYLGANSRLLASGTTVLDAKTRMALETGSSVATLLGKRAYTGNVLDGGTVTIDAGLGYVVTRDGSLVDVSGTTATLSQPDLSYKTVAYDTQTVGSAGGIVSVAAHDGMFLDGSFAAAGGQNAIGGSFVLHFSDTSSFTTPVADPWNVQKESYTDEELAAKAGRVLTLYQSSGDHANLWPDDIDSVAYLAGDATINPLAHNGKASLDLAKLDEGSFGSWYLTSQNEMTLNGIVDVSVANQVQLSAPVFNAGDAATHFSLNAASVRIGNTYGDAGTAKSAISGSAVADISARDIGLVGTFTWSGFGDTTFKSKGEIHFDSTQNSLALRPGGRTYNGQMTASGNLELSAARLSPSTYSDFRIDLLSDTDSSITITRPVGATADISLSAAGRLELAANTITHHGTISAPLGEVVFTAPDDTGSVLLGSDSITSVAAVSNLLFGYTTESASAWQYNGLTVSSMPDKAIRIEAANTVVATGAQVDLSGGGDALAWEFTSGPGGKSDVLAASSDTYAIIPNWNGLTATDGQLQQGYTISSDGSTPVLKAGDSISLGNNPAGLSGSYILLPARYAVLPGAYLVTVKTTNGTVLRKGQTQADGSWLVNATRSTLNADGSYSSTSTSVLTVELASSNVVANRAEYITSSANEFFYGQSSTPLPGDAGRLTAIGHSTLSFDPAVTAMRVAEISAADGRVRAGRGLEVDLAAPNILISDGPSATGNGWSVLDQNKLNALAASSLLIGGTRSVSVGKTTIETLSANVTVSNTSGALSAAEIMLAATDTITVTGNSAINSSGSADDRAIVLAGDGAFLRAAEGEQASLSRTGTITRTRGDLIVESGAVVGGESLVFDATRENRLEGSVDLGDRQTDGSRSGGNIRIGAGRINVVGNMSSSTPSDGLVLGNDDLAAYAAADQIHLASYTTLDLYGNATIGTASLAELVIDSAGIAGHGQSTNVATIEAQSVVFQNSSPESASFTSTGLGDGQLAVNAKTVEFANNATSGSDETMREKEKTGFGIRGFTDVALKATGDVRFSGTGVTTIDNDATFGGNAQSANLTISANRVVTVGTADHLLTASDTTTISHHANATGSNEGTGLGGSLELRAQSMDISGRLSAAAGNLVLSARDNIAIHSGAHVAAEGTHVNFDDATVYAGGGTVTLKSTQSDVTIESGAVASVSADSGGGNAGTLTISAGQGEVSVAAGTLHGSANDDSTQGVLNVDAAEVDFDSLAGAVTDASGDLHFTEGWSVRKRSGDLVLNESIKAHDVILSADAGNIDVNGTIDASGAKGGDIALYANRQAGTGGRIDLRAGSRLLAYATESVGKGQGTDGQGGKVIVGISASSATDEMDTAINFAGAGNGKAAALIDVSTAEGSAAQGGEVTFRLPRQDGADETTLASLTLAGNVEGAAATSVEGVRTTRKTGNYTLNASQQAALFTNAEAMAQSGSTAVSGADTGGNGFVFRIGEEVRATGNITVSSDWDLSAARFAGQPGTLTLRAEGNLNLNATISDGFEGYTSYDDTTVFSAVSRDARLMDGGDSWSYRLVAGADTNQASPLAVKENSSNGSIVVAANKLIRTGTGDIELAAAGDIKLRTGAAIYTAGVATTTPDGFNFTAAQTPTTASSTYDEAYFANGGGDISLHAGGNVVMTGNSDSQLPTLRSINQWLFRAGGEGSDLQWWSRIASFQQGVAAFGGGDIAVSAGKNVSNLLAAIPTNGRVPTDTHGNSVPTEVLVQGGGDLTVHAGGAIAGGLYYVETGSMKLDAEAVTSTNSDKNYTNIALGNADVSITATEDITLGRVFNPLWTKTDYVYNDGTTPTSWDALNVDTPDFQVRFGTYGSESEIDVLSLEGDVTLDSSKVYGVTDSEAGPVMPSVVRLAALSGSINIDGALIQSPGKNGQLDLLAGESITLSKDITQLDIGQSMLPSLYNPVVNNYVSTSGKSFRLTNLADSVREAHSDSLWHASDYEASRVIAQNGEITGSENVGSSSIFNEAVTVIAGGDISNVNLDVQHAHETDVSRIIAGGDINYVYYTDSAPGEQTSVSTQALGIQLGGAGRLEVVAGGDIDLADTNGIVTRGNLDNPFLSETGANISVMAGAQVTDAAAANYANYDALRAYLQGSGTLATYLKTAGIDAADLASMSDAALRDAFYHVVRAIGRDAVETGDKTLYTKGRELIAAFFPNTEGSGNDILLSVSQIKTERGGDIQLLTPTGSVIVGVAAPTLTKEASKQGIFTISGGDIFGMVEKNYLVNQSRTFTLDGGDIMLWSNHGDIDAGRGAKTQVATPPPVLVIRNGQIVVDTANAVTGSGIGVLASQDDTPASDMDLFAPDGTIDAGDAGLRSTGNIKLGAAVILNSSNISAGGAVSGAPAPVAAAAPATSVTSPSETASKGGEEIAATATSKEETLGVLTVEVLDSGESTTPADKDDEKKKKKENS